MEQAFRMLYPRRWRIGHPRRFNRVRVPIRMGAGVAQVVGNNAGFNATATGSVSVTLTVSAGSSLVVFVTWGTSTTAQGDAVTCADSQSGIYQDGEFLQFSAITQSGAKFFRENVSGGSITVTATFVSGTASFNAIYVAEVTGSAGIIDATNAQQQGTVTTSADAISAGPMYSSGSPGLIVGFSMSMNAVAIPTSGTGFTSDLSDATTMVCFEHQRITTTAPTSVTPTFTTSNGTSSDLFTGGYYILESTPSTIYVKQRRRANGTTGATTLAITLNVTAGSLLHVYTCGGFSTSLTMTVTDPTNGTYSASLDTVHEPTVNNVLVQQQSSGNTASGSLTITVTYSASTTSRSIAVVEIINASSATPEAHTSNNQTPTTTGTDATTSGSVTIVNGGMILGMSAFLSSTAGNLGTVGGNQGTNFAGGLSIFAGEVSNFHAVVENKLNSSAGSVAATFSATTTAGAVSFVAYYDGSTGGQPTINTQPSSTSIMLGNTATFSVSATPSGGTLSYQWQKNGSNVSGATSSSYTTPVLLFSDNLATFDCVVTDSNGSTTTAAAFVTITPPIPYLPPSLIFLLATGGPNHFLVPLSETLSLAEARAIIFGAKVTGLAESVTTTESEATRFGAHPTLTESVALSEAIAEKFAAKPHLSETVSVVESEATKFSAKVTGLALVVTVIAAKLVVAETGASDVLFPNRGRTMVILPRATGVEWPQK